MKDAQRSAMSGTARLATAAAALLVVGIAGTWPAAADMAVVQQDATPIVSQPGVGGRILTRVDAGFSLIVLGSEGDWLRVASPRLHLTGDLWVPAGRVSDIVAVPTDLPPSDGTSAVAAMPQFRIETTSTGAMAVPSPNMTTPNRQNGSRSVSAAVARSAPTDGTVSATGAAQVSAPATAAGSSSSPTSAATGNATSASANGVPSPGDPTPALGNSTPVVGNPTPAVGNPTPAVGNPTPAMGNSAPAMGNSVVGFGNANNATQ